ncbi:MAG: phosphate/phosphite/phosphonate ABC transporter substrate-binding protein [Thiohalorhabdus sp.]|uniref:phosphate/phosphite/phosphonate ABC transporter substrate-binding protein n=1 Tax=Thiohalorhabdus sp. TaxID=3094134 RepID=UPI00397FA3E6
MPAPMSLAKRLAARGFPTLAGLLLLLGAPALPAEEPERLRLLLPPLSTADKMYARFQPLAGHLEKALGIPVKARVAGDLESLLRLARQDRPQIVYLCPLVYARLADEGALRPLARIERQGKDTFRSVVVVRKESPYQELKELKGARFAYGDPVCAASRLVPKTMFAKAGIHPHRDFFEERTLGSNENALYSVATDLFDATAVDESAAHPFLEKGVLRPLEYSRPIPQYLLAASARLSDSFRERLVQALTDLKRPQATATLRAIGADVDGFSPTSDDDYDTLRSMERRHGSPETPLNLLNPSKRPGGSPGR